MPFGNITTLYLPTAANAGASQWATDVRKLLSSADSGSDAGSKTDHGTNGAAQNRTVDPYTTTTTDFDQSTVGWAVDPSDMGSVTGALRFFPVGNHVATVQVGHNAVTASSATITMYVYKVGSAASGRTRTLLASGASATINLPLNSGEATFLITVSVPEVIFQPDETIQYSFELSSPGIVILGHICTFYTGTQSGVVGRIDTPKLGVLADTTGSASGSGTAEGVGGKVLGLIGSSSGTSSADGVGGSTSTTTGSSSGSGSANGLGSSVAGSTGSTSGSSSVNGQASIVLGVVGVAVVGEGGGITIRPLILFDD